MVMEPDDTDSIGRAHLQDPAERTHTIARRSGHDIAHTQPGLVLRHVLAVVADVRKDR